MEYEAVDTSKRASKDTSRDASQDTGKDIGKDTRAANRPDIYVLKLQKGQAYYLTELGKTLVEE